MNDPSTYPVIGICAGACVFAGGYISYKVVCDRDVRFAPTKRGATIRFWGN